MNLTAFSCCKIIIFHNKFVVNKFFLSLFQVLNSSWAVDASKESWELSVAGGVAKKDAPQPRWVLNIEEKRSIISIIAEVGSGKQKHLDEFAFSLYLAVLWIRIAKCANWSGTFLVCEKNDQKYKITILFSKITHFFG